MAKRTLRSAPAGLFDALPAAVPVPVRVPVASGSSLSSAQRSRVSSVNWLAR
jgi:hypothetical protein